MAGERIGRYAERAALIGCNAFDDEGQLNAFVDDLRQLLDNLALKSRVYDEWATAYAYHSQTCALREEPIMMAFWSNRVSYTHEEMKALDGVRGDFRRLFEDFMMGQVFVDGKRKVLIGNETQPYLRGVRIILRGDGYVQERVRELLANWNVLDDTNLPGSSRVFPDGVEVYNCGYEAEHESEILSLVSH